jgi:hypothetical protein
VVGRTKGGGPKEERMNLLVKSCLRRRAYTEAEARHLVRLSHRQRGEILPSTLRASSREGVL